MTSTPAPCLLQLRLQLDERWPGRSRLSDGIMGDRSHQARRSDHNLGNAIDITHDPVNGPDAGVLAEELRSQMAAGARGRPTYVIWNARIASSGSLWRWRPYRGANPHRSHVHISIGAGQRGVVRPWRLW